MPLLVRIGKGKPIADDERTREVGPSSSSCEAGEQGGAIRRGAGGAKGWDQGECKPATLGPDAEPGKPCHRCWRAYVKPQGKRRRNGSQRSYTISTSNCSGRRSLPSGGRQPPA